MNVEESAKNLLKLVEGYRSQECREAMDKARAEAASILRRAWRREREHLHSSVQAERSRARALIQAAQAERATRERASGDRQNAVLLAEAWPRLRALLLARWRDPAGRETWVARALDQARRSLPAGPWTVRHAPDWAPPEAPGPSLALAAGTKGGGQALRFLADPGIAAGLIVEGGAAVLDASLDGLLADRQRLEARLLALLAAREAGHGAASATAAAGLGSPPADHPAPGAAPKAQERRP
jgi:vacuolar-type H+-ATPase subunit H